MTDQWSLSRKRGWHRSTNSEQAEAWEEYCFSEGLDCITIREDEDGLVLSCAAHPDRPLTELAYAEVEDLLKRYDIPSGSWGAWKSRPSEFDFEIPSEASIEEMISEVRQILRRDRTSLRLSETSVPEGLSEGMARPLDLSILWPEHPADESVYILEMQGQPGRCLVFKHLHPPLVNLPLAAFRLLPHSDV